MPASPSIEEQLADAQAEVQRLREHADQVLTEKKRLQAQLADLAGLQEKYEAASQELTHLKLDLPVDALAAEIAVDPKLFKTLWNEGHRFALDDQGRPCVQTADGKPIMVKGRDGNETPLPFEAKAIVEYLYPTDPKLHTADSARFGRVLIGSAASGGGASGGAGPGASRSEPAKKKAADAPQFGLR
jgi:hypothetical protein